ncbi:rhodanese-like domain-containing protein [Neolewinella sp.]|uniref:rhodanese-like domain-containing protein n=1 Tax=Neolewinella sp. TaxID=2993543 RepID=UPI003B530268
MRYLALSLSALGLLLLYGCRSAAPPAPERLRTAYAPLDRKLRKLVPIDSFTISAVEAYQLPEAVFLDARERQEYEVSHLPGARYLGFSTPDTTAVKALSHNTPLVVYCTVGYRSARLAQELRRAGFKRVYNLYGSIYAWRLAGLPLVDAAGPTPNIHTYNRKWGRFIPDTLGTKVY